MSAPLAARIERAECRLLADSAAAAARRHPETAVFAIPLADGVATFTSPGAPMNKVAGLGFGGPLDEAEIEAVEEAFAERGSPVQAEVATLADPAVVQALSRRGYVLLGFENVLGRSLPAEPLPPRGPGIEVVTSPLDELRQWIDVVVAGFATPDTLGVPSHESHPPELVEVVMVDMASADGFSRYLARREGVAAGVQR